jgi:predicted DNA-binding protein (MmcQ/YjbR family)
MTKHPVKARRNRTKRSGSVPSKRAAAVIACIEAKPGIVGKPITTKSSTDGVVIYKVMGKMLAILTIRGVESVILKCDPNLAHALRQQYTGVGHRSHLDRRYWISVTLDADLPADEIERLVGHSYDLVCAGLSRKQQAELETLRK